MNNADKVIIRDCVIDWTDATQSLQLERSAHDIFIWTVNEQSRIKSLCEKGFNVLTDVLPC